MHYHINRKSAYSVASIADDSLEIVSAIISVDLHSFGSVKRQAITLMYADALLSGAGKYNREEFLDALHILGAAVNIGVVNGVLAISIRSTAAVFAKVLQLVDLLFREPHFSVSDLERIQNTVTNALHEHKENSKALALEMLKNELYGEADRKYTFSADETIESLKTVTMDDLRSFHNEMMAGYWICTIAGNAKMIQLFESLVTKNRKEISIENISAAHEVVSPKNKVQLKSLPSRQNIDLSIGASIPFTLHHPDYVPLSFALAVLGKWGGFSGRLMSTVREKEGLTYGIYATLEGFSGGEQGYWRIMTFFAPEKALQGITSTFREIDKLYKKGITKAEFDSFKTILITGQTLIQDSVLSQMNDLHAYHFHGFTLTEMAERKNKINTVTFDEVNKAIRNYLNPQTLIIAGAGPVEGVKRDIQEFIKNLK